MENIFTLFPANRTRLFSEEERSDLEINLHAFLINSHGIPDNLALAYVEENNLQIPRHRAGMFRKEIKPHLPEKVRTYLDSNNISSWHKEYAKNYRDALAHRIPPYIPPLLYTAEHQFQYKEFETRIKVAMEVEGSFERAVTLVEEQETIGIICPFFMHSHTDSDAMQFHPQIIVDARTVIEIISVVRPHLTAR
ncbi:hypothetical protein [Nitrospira defluvii]|nr:hypothetical protein [Nitrospira defluvii]